MGAFLLSIISSKLTLLLDVVKTVVVQPPVIAIPFSAKIEYYDPRTEDLNVLFGSTKHKNKAEPRVVQFGNVVFIFLSFFIVQQIVTVLPPVIVDDLSATSDTDGTSMSRSTSSLADLFELFPAPPTFIPEPRPAVIHRINESATGNAPSTPWPVYPVTAADESGDRSDTESVASAYSSGLLSNETADTTLPSSPASANDPVMTAHCPDGKNPLRGPDAFSGASGIDATVRAARTTQQYDRDLLPVLNTKGLVKRSHDVVDGFERADLHRDDVVNETSSKAMKPVRGPQAAMDILTTSPSEDAVVDDLLARLETSFELDRARATPRCSEEKDILFAGRMYPDSTPLPVPACSVAPLRIVKKKAAVITPPSESSDAHLNQFTANWERSMEDVLRTFKEVEAEDADFHDLFYKDAPFLSQSSLARETRGSNEGTASVTCRSGPSSLEVCDEDESFENAEQSVEEHISASDLANIASMVETHEQALAGSSLSMAAVIRDIPPNIVKPSVNVTQGIRSDTGTGHTEFRWATRSCDGSDDEDEDDIESEGEQDQWSDLFELNTYMG